MYSGGDTNQVKKWMEDFKATGKLDFSLQVVQEMKQKLGVESVSASTAQVNDVSFSTRGFVVLTDTTQCIYQTYKTSQYLLDPHTAVGVSAAIRSPSEDLTVRVFMRYLHR